MEFVIFPVQKKGYCAFLYSLLTIILSKLSSALYYVDGLPRFDEKKPVYKLGLLLNYT